jgi:phage major head subunit gpT-like protein
MHCLKCNGKMAHERYYDFLDETGKYSFEGWRCLVCGDIVDPVILGNRKARVFPKPRTIRKRRFSLA